MVRGLDVLRERLGAYHGQYALIGGAACDILMDRAGLEFRATKDLDIVLIVASLDAGFGNAFWELIKAGGYEVQQRSAGDSQYYRFQKPAEQEFPYMIELFSSRPNLEGLAKGSHLTPIPIDEDVSSLSAILLNDEYYRFLQSGIMIIGGLPVVDAEHLIPLKVKAWLDLTQKKAAGGNVDSRDIKKHMNDVFRLFLLLQPGFKADLDDLIRGDMSEFLEAMRNQPIDLGNFDITDRNLESVLHELGDMYISVRSAV